jgi:hypothetical protein
MTGTNELLELLTFSCPACQAQLTVPARLAGIEGPCPSCYQAIRAPQLPPVTAGKASVSPVSSVSPPVAGVKVPAWDESLPILSAPPVFPPRPLSAPPGPPGQALPVKGPQFDQLLEAVPDKSFKARLAIRPPDEPPDDTWKDRHRDQARGRRRVRRAERAAQSFLDSRAFRLTRVTLILLSAGMVAWLILHMKDNQWNLPGLSRPLANEATPQPGAVPMKSPPVLPQTSALPGDDDADLPAPGDAIPGNPAAGSNIAAPR